MPESLGRSATPSHLILHVSDTSATVRFYQSLFGVTATDDHSFGSPSLDAIFRPYGRPAFGRPSSTYSDTAFTRSRPWMSHVRRGPNRASKIWRTIRPILRGAGSRPLTRSSDEAGGLNPTPIYEFSHGELDHVARMFFLADPDYVRLELIAAR